MKKIVLKRALIICIVVIVCACTNKKVTEEQTLHKRFSVFIKSVAGNDTSTALSYIYPELFKHIPRDEAEITIGNSDDDDPAEKIEIDSVRIDTIYPIFHVEKGSYTIAIYSLNMFGDSDTTQNLLPYSIKHLIGDTYPTPQITLMATLMKQRFDIEITDLKLINGKMLLKARIPVIAVKDEHSKDWNFLTITSDRELLNKLFSKKVLEKLATYN